MIITKILHHFRRPPVMLMTDARQCLYGLPRVVKPKAIPKAAQPVEDATAATHANASRCALDDVLNRPPHTVKPNPLNQAAS